MEEPTEDLSVEQAMQEFPHSDYQGKRIGMNSMGNLEFSLNKDSKQLFRIALDPDGSISINIPQVSKSVEGLVFHAKQYFDSVGEVPRILPMSPDGMIFVDSEDSGSIFILRSNDQESSKVEVDLLSRRLDKKDAANPINPLVEFIAKTKGIPAQPVQRTFDSILRERAARPQSK